jgi:hypothetical protein
MKKSMFTALLAVLAFSAFGADYATVEVDHVRDAVTKQSYVAEYVRFGAEVAGLQLGVQDRTGDYRDGSGLFHSTEVTVGKTVFGATPFIGAGWDDGKNGGKGNAYQYGLVGVNAGLKAGPGFAFGGVKTRFNTDASINEPKQTVAYGTYSIPVIKKVNFDLNLSKSFQDIRENSYGLGVTVNF